MAWRDFYNRDVFEHTHASTKPRYRRASYSVLGDGISCEIPPAELVQPRDRVAPNLATTILATARRNSLYPNLFVPGHPLSQNDARGKLERFSRATVRLLAFYHSATLNERKRPLSLRAAFQTTSRKDDLKDRTRGAFHHQVPSCHASDKGWPHFVPT